MILGKHTGLSLFAVAALLFASCGGGGSSDTSNTIASAVQDLAQDPEGAITVLTFDSAGGLAAATTANFEADGGQVATDVSVADAVVTITWDARVSPSTQVRAIGLSGVASSYSNVTTSDASAPTFVILGGDQNTGLGGDIAMVEFSGPHVLASEAEDITNWTLQVEDTTLDLTGSTFTFDPDTQTMSMAFGTFANLHADFTLSASGVHSVADVSVSTTVIDGTATGDAVAPTLTSADQNLDEDEYGRVVDFTFSESMDPVFATILSNFDASPAIATLVEQPAENILRVTFSAPIIPGVDEVTLASVVDAHGNALPDGAQAISQPDPVTNAFDGAPLATTVANSGADMITIVTTQALDPDSAIDPTSWVIDVDGGIVDLSTQTLEYDFLAKTLTVTLDFDMLNGQTFSVTALGVLEVDGEGFLDTYNGAVSGDGDAPTVLSATQNRTFDLMGTTLDVVFSEDLDQASAETLANWTTSGAPAVMSASLLPSLDTVRLVFDAATVPGDVTLDVQNILDLAGNALVYVPMGYAIVSTDTTAPAPITASATSIAGGDNDTLAVMFDDDMIESEIEDASNWTVETPVGTAATTTGLTVSYDDATRTATLVFDSGLNLQRGDDFNVTFANARDLGGNTIGTAVLTGAIDAESTLPTVVGSYYDTDTADEVVLYFSEPCSNLDDLYDASTNPAGTRYVLRDSGGIQRGMPISTTILDNGLGVRIAYGIVIGSSDKIDVYGVTDLTGNPMFPVQSRDLLGEENGYPSLDMGLSVFTSTSGENNDVVAVQFDRPMSSWELLDPAHYTLTGIGALDLTTATFSFDGSQIVTIDLAGASEHDLQTGSMYSIEINDVRSAQGALRSSPNSESGFAASGDATAPTIAVGRVRLDPSDANSLLIESDEALDPTSAATAANYDYNSGNIATMATLLGPRTVRATFAVTPAASFTLDATIMDRAGNVSGTISRTVTAADTAGPLVASVSGTITPNLGGDVVHVSFSEPVTSGSALSPTNYSILSGTTPISLTGATFTYASGTNAVAIHLASGQELIAGAAVNVTVGGVRDYSANAMASTIMVGGSVSGDTTAPSMAESFVNWRADASGATVDVLFSEDVNATFAASASNWTVSGGQTISSVTMLETNHARFVLSAPLGASDTLDTAALPDMARNVSGSISIDPQE